MTKLTFRKKLKEITTAYFIGLGYTVPPYNGLHSKEFFDQICKLILEDIIGKDELISGASFMGKSIQRKQREKLGL